MATITQGGFTYTLPDSVTNPQSVIDKINAAANGEKVPGVNVVKLPAPEAESSGSSLTTIALLGGLGYLLFKK
jgi:hypothetical protein